MYVVRYHTITYHTVFCFGVYNMIIDMCFSDIIMSECDKNLATIVVKTCISLSSASVHTRSGNGKDGEMALLFTNSQRRFSTDLLLGPVKAHINTTSDYKHL